MGPRFAIETVAQPAMRKTPITARITRIIVQAKMAAFSAFALSYFLRKQTDVRPEFFCEDARISYHLKDLAGSHAFNCADDPDQYEKSDDQR